MAAAATTAVDALPPLPIPLTPLEEALKSAYLPLLKGDSVKSEILLGDPPLDLRKIQQITDLPGGTPILRIYQFATELLRATPSHPPQPARVLSEMHVPNNWMENLANPVAWAATLRTLGWQGVLLEALNKGDPELLRTLLPSLKHLLPKDPYSPEVFDVLLMADLEPDMRHQLMKVVVEGLLNPSIDWKRNLDAQKWADLAKHYSPKTDDLSAQEFSKAIHCLGLVMRVERESNDVGFFGEKLPYNTLSTWVALLGEYEPIQLSSNDPLDVYKEESFAKLARELLCLKEETFEKGTRYAPWINQHEEFNYSLFLDPRMISALVFCIEESRIPKQPPIPPEEPSAKRQCLLPGAAAAAAANS